MRLSDISVKRPVTTVMVIFMILLIGFVSLSRLSIDLLPQINVPVALVTTQYSGVGPYEMESLITRPLEEVLATTSNVKSISSTSSEGNSVVVVEFNEGIDMDFATLHMREKIDLIKDFLPEGASAPMVMKIDPNAMPVVQFSVTGNKNLEEVQRIADTKIKSRLERLPGVASVEVYGGFEKEVKVTVHPIKLEGYGLSIEQLAGVLRNENLNLPAGVIERNDRELLVRTLGEFQSIEQIANLPITLKTGGVIRLKDVADVRLTAKEADRISRMNGEDSIVLIVNKQSTYNTVRVSETVNTEIEKLKTELEDVKFTTIFDQSEYINMSIGNVARSGLVGGILAILILYLFLRNIRTTFIIAIAIPISVVATFSLMYFSGVTLNLMTLGGLALGMGMLVDNSIVVLENIYRFRQEGYSRIEAAMEGTSEVGMAVTASTLTTVAVFLPIVFVEGITSMLFKELAMTVTFSLLASLFVSLTIVPMLASQILKISKNGKAKVTVSDRILTIFDRFFLAMDNRYRNILGWSLNHRKSIVAMALIIFVSSIALATTVGAEFFPAMDQGQISITVELPPGSKQLETDEVVSKIEKIAGQMQEVDLVFVLLGGSSNIFSNTSGSGNRAEIYIMLKEINERERNTEHVADEIRLKASDIAGAKISVAAMEGAGMGFAQSPISIEVKGDDMEILQQISDDISDIVKSVNGTREVKTNFEEGNPELQVLINREMASQYGLGTSQIAQSIRNAINGIAATKYKVDGTEVDVVLRSDEYIKESIANFKQLQIMTPLGVTIPLEQVVEIEVKNGPNQISRNDQVRTITVTGDVLGRDLRSIVVDIETKLQNYTLPEGYSYEIGGENEDLVESFRSLGLAIILAVVLVYMVLASQFESLLHPFIIMFSVPLAFSGGAFALFITQRSLSVPAIIGAIVLAGIVVNNAIVLIDYTNILRKKGMEINEAILQAGPTRLRPILMTTLTTILGLIPLAIGSGEGSEAQAPLATVVIGGLLLSTLLTLVFIPVVYITFDRISAWIRNKVTKKKNTVVNPQ